MRTPLTLLVLLAALAATACAPRARLAGADVLFPDLRPDTVDATMLHVAAGGAVVAFLSMPEAARPGGPVLDPASIRATFDGEPCAWHLVYRLPQLPAVAVLLPEDALARGGGELRIRAGLLGHRGDAFDARRRLEPADGARPIWSEFTVNVVDAQGDPMPGALLYGQHLKGLFRRTGGEGVAHLDALVRGRIEAHLAYAPGHWAAAFDPRTVTGAALRPVAPDAARAVRELGGIAPQPLAGGPRSPRALGVREVAVELAADALPQDGWALVEVAGRYWLALRGADTHRVLLPDDGAAHLLVASAPGHLPVRVEVPAAAGNAVLRLAPMPTSDAQAGQNTP
ncbi:MAG: hypothetical protein SF028_00245 [Candidatus Sumerlaeia bacterium]|nr:hypothetical protein [Candidatus Sumerlaeia bacterium]